MLYGGSLIDVVSNDSLIWLVCVGLGASVGQNYFLAVDMAKPSAVSIFLAASSLLLASADLPLVQAQDAGGLKEWTTDQAVDDESVMNEEAEAFLEKAEQEDICVPIGEGENCW